MYVCMCMYVCARVCVCFSSSDNARACACVQACVCIRSGDNQNNINNKQGKNLNTGILKMYDTCSNENDTARSVSIQQLSSDALLRLCPVFSVNVSILPRPDKPTPIVRLN